MVYSPTYLRFRNFLYPLDLGILYPNTCIHNGIHTQWSTDLELLSTQSHDPASLIMVAANYSLFWGQDSSEELSIIALRLLLT